MDTLDDVDIDDDVDTELEVDTLKGKESYYLKNFKSVQIVLKIQGIRTPAKRKETGRDFFSLFKLVQTLI